ncbi:addiction module toxin RelE [Lujinxingia vulgaris]|uniref:Addiction module toxin RelE n=1 Tax=Lujinxingia vulgaris TaxID=2600176 RepID=A0A5C6X811_9DELT|nr:type II toxin-antitoxin system RelE/ParE family toxin [Lujinxingia vulgaris]TXD32938.1 addiction module toxin RelE [Lujinxingia vulgaris]
MKTQILVTDEYSEWFGSLDATEKKAVRRVVAMLEQMGVTLPFPYSSSLKNTSHPLRELRVKAKGTQIRVIYGFDPTRNALLLIGATKAGSKRFYEQLISLAEKIWEDFHQETP